MRRRLASLVVVALASAGCVGGPDVFDSRERLPSCGRVDVGHGAANVDDPRAARCLLRAQARGRPAELVVVTTTVEGDPITSYYRVLARGRVEVWHDSTQDAYGSRQWSHHLCSSVRVAASSVEGVGCERLELHARVTSTPERGTRR